MSTSGRAANLPRARQTVQVDPKGRLQVYAALEEYEKEREKTKKEVEDVLKDITLTKPQLLEFIGRTRKATKYLISLLPKLDLADRGRLARSSEPVASVTEMGYSGSDD